MSAASPFQSWVCNPIRSVRLLPFAVHVTASSAQLPPDTHPPTHPALTPAPLPTRVRLHRRGVRLVRRPAGSTGHERRRAGGLCRGHRRYCRASGKAAQRLPAGTQNAGAGAFAGGEQQAGGGGGGGGGGGVAGRFRGRSRRAQGRGMASRSSLACHASGERQAALGARRCRRQAHSRPRCPAAGLACQCRRCPRCARPGCRRPFGTRDRRSQTALACPASPPALAPSACTCPMPHLPMPPPTVQGLAGAARTLWGGDRRRQRCALRAELRDGWLQLWADSVSGQAPVDQSLTFKHLKSRGSQQRSRGTRERREGGGF